MSRLTVFMTLLLSIFPVYGQALNSNINDTATLYKIVPGSNIAIKLSNDFIPAKRFSGYINPHHSIAIVVAQFPTSNYQNFAQSFQQKKFGEKLFHPEFIGKLKQRTDEHLYIEGIQKTPAGQYAKLILLFRSPSLTAMININLPKNKLKEVPQLRDKLRRILVQARVARQKKTASFPYRLSYLGLFQPMGNQSGLTRTYTVKDWGRGKKQQYAPLLVLAPSLHQKPVPDLHQTGIQLLKKLGIIQKVSIMTSRRVHIDGKNGIEFQAHAKTSLNKRDVFVYQVLIAGHNGGYIRLLGICDQKAQKLYLPQFMKIAAGMVTQEKGQINRNLSVDNN